MESTFKKLATHLTREEKLKFISENKKRIDYLLIYKWDRFSRNTMEAMNMISQFKGFGV